MDATDRKLVKIAGKEDRAMGSGTERTDNPSADVSRAEAGAAKARGDLQSETFAATFQFAANAAYAIR